MDIAKPAPIAKRLLLSIAGIALVATAALAMVPPAEEEVPYPVFPTRQPPLAFTN